MSGVYHHTQLIGCGGDIDNFIPRLTWNPDPLQFCLLRNWDYRCELLHLAWSVYFLNECLVTRSMH
jgi:hypothetical protein